MVGHQNIGVYGAMISMRGGAQCIQVKLVITGPEESGLAINTTLNHVLRKVWNKIAGLTGHLVPVVVSASSKLSLPVIRDFNKSRFDPN